MLTQTDRTKEEILNGIYNTYFSYIIQNVQEEWKDKILFVETCEEKPTPELLEKELLALKEKGVFDAVSGILVSKPQDETYYEEYKAVYAKVIENKELPIVYNVNFGHASPRCALLYGAFAEVDMEKGTISYE